MLAKLFVHLRQQWMGGLALFLVLAGGTAYAANVANTVGSSDIIDESILSQDVKDGEIKQNPGGNSAVKSGKIADNSLPGPDMPDGQIGNAHLANAAGSSASVSENSP